ncbi:unnamed protein product, partial [marine sediment metagenome]
FILEGESPATWMIHPLMREGLAEYQDAETHQQVHQFLFDHYRQPLKELDSQTITDVHKTFFAEAFYQGKDILGIEEFSEWFSGMRSVFMKMALWQFLIPLMEEFTGLIEGRLGPEHPDTATSLDNLAMLYWHQGRYEEAEPFYKRALAIHEKVSGAEHPDTANSLNNLATLYGDQGRYEEAEPFYKRALAIHEKVSGAEHPDTANSLNNLATLYGDQGRYEEAEPFYKRALAIREKVLGAEHPSTATSLNNLAML